MMTKKIETIIQKTRKAQGTTLSQLAITCNIDIRFGPKD